MRTTFPRWPARLLASLDAAEARARASARELSEAQLNWSPRPGSWSIGQVLQHLIMSNEVYLPAIRDAIRGKPPRPVEEIALPWFSRWFIARYIENSPVTDPRARRVEAPVKIRPPGSAPPNILKTYLSNDVSLREVIVAAANLDVNRVRFRNPFVTLLRFTVGTGLEILLRHQHRHMGQIERVRISPGFPGAG